MDWTNLYAVLTVLLGGTNIFQFFFFRAERQKHQAEADAATIDVQQKKQDMQQDAYEDLVNRLGRFQHDYLDLAEQMQEQTRAFLVKINDKCNEIAELKSKIIYFKGLRCYKSDCPIRIGTNPKDNTNDSNETTDSNDNA